LKTAFPTHEWHPWKFSKVYPGFWRNPDNVRLYVEWLGKELRLNDLSDWYNVSPTIMANDHSV